MEKLTEVTPSERFQLLRKKGFYIQFPFLGVYQNKAKHSNGKCLRDFVCKYENNQSKSMYRSAMSTEVILKINSYCRNIKIDASLDKLKYQHFQMT